MAAHGPAPADDQETDVVALLAHLLHERTGWPTSLITSTEWSSTFRIHRRLAERFRSGRVLLAGDAAHVHSPLGGQGLNTGVGDADNLAWKLALVALGRAGDSLLDSYEAERRPIAEEVLQSTTAMTRMVVGDSRVARVIRDRVFVPALNRPAVQRRVWEQASQLKVSYRRGPLGARAMLRIPRRPCPGDRVADMTCTRLGGSQTRLHQELGARWAVLLPARVMADADTRACIDVVQSLLWPGLVTVLAGQGLTTSDLLLVRPDGHLAWRGQPDPAKVDYWLRVMLNMRAQAQSKPIDQTSAAPELTP